MPFLLPLRDTASLGSVHFREARNTSTPAFVAVHATRRAHWETSPNMMIRAVPHQRVLDAILNVLGENTQQSSGATDRMMRQVSTLLEAEHGVGTVPLPSTSTFQRLLRRLAEGRHATSPARTRRTLAQQPGGLFGAVYPVRPGELMQIYSTPLDIAVELGDGVIGRVELTAMVDNATRSIPAAVIRPTTKAVDAALLWPGA